MKRKIGISFIILAVSLAVVMSSASVTATGLEYPAPFKIQKIFVSGATNYHFRVISNNSSAWLCANGPKSPYEAWAFINEADDGAKAKIATLTTAYVLEKNVALTTVGEQVGSNTYCHIVEVQIY